MGPQLRLIGASGDPCRMPDAPRQIRPAGRARRHADRADCVAQTVPRQSRYPRRSTREGRRKRRSALAASEKSAARFAISPSSADRARWPGSRTLLGDGVEPSAVAAPIPPMGSDDSRRTRHRYDQRGTGHFVDVRAWME